MKQVDFVIATRLAALYSFCSGVSAWVITELTKLPKSMLFPFEIERARAELNTQNSHKHMNLMDRCPSSCR